MASEKAHKHHLRHMFDSTQVSAIPADADLIAAYQPGDPYPNIKEVRARFPKADIVSIALHPSIEADCLDIEKGGAVITDFPDWCRRQHKRGIERPILYTFLSQLQATISNAESHGLKFDKDFRVWSAHPNGIEHRCGPGCGWGLKEHVHGTQYLWQPTLDTSLVGANFASH